jgi:hypothetical protein
LACIVHLESWEEAPGGKWKTKQLEGLFIHYKCCDGAGRKAIIRKK